MNRDVGCVLTTGLMIFVFLFTAIAPVNAGREVRLILQITVDGLRGDLLSRYGDRFGLDGFRYLLEDGTVFTNAHYQHANTETIVGHTTLATGTSPSLHGMIGNVWLDRESGELGYNIEDPAIIRKLQRNSILPKRRPVQMAVRLMRYLHRPFRTSSLFIPEAGRKSLRFREKTAGLCRWRGILGRPFGTPPTAATLSAAATTTMPIPSGL